jgi:tetratricopeptide (TPR) repeat protein
VRALVETVALAGERGAYRLTRPVAQLTIPATVQAILAARIDRLAPEAKRLLQAAAVIGTDVPMPLLLAIADAPEPEVRAELTHLQAAEFLYETRLFPDLEYTFKHALTHEVAYSTVLHDRRRHLHTQITHSIERLYPERLQEHVEQLAHHAFRGELWETAIVYLRQAAAKAMTRSAHREAATYLQQTLDVLAHVPQTREYLAEGIDVRFALRYALSPLGDWAQALDYVEEAGRLAEALGDQRRLGWAQANMVAPLSLRGDHTRAVEVGERALAIAKNVEDVGLQRETEFYVALAHGNLGNYDQAIMLLREIIAAMVGEWKYWGTPGISSVLSGAYLAVYLSRLGQFPEAIHHSDAALRIAEDAAKPYSQIFAYVGAAQVYLNQGDTSKAIPLLERSLQLGVSWDIPALRPWGTASLSLALGRIGRVTEAMSLAAELGSLADLPSGRASPPLLWLSEIYFTTGRVADALPLADRALSLSRECHEQGHEAQALHLQGELAAHREPVDVERARHFYLQALALAEPRGMRPLVAHCHLGLATLYRRTGDAAKTQEHLSTATAMYREMGMNFWLAKAEAEHRGGAR